MRDRLNRQGMTLERAQDIVAHVIAKRDRWGKHYEGEDLPKGELLDALIFSAQHESQDVVDLRASLKQKTGELNAAKAREARINKINGELREEIQTLQDSDRGAEGEHGDSA